jgi:type II secretory pathway pseudopilin PulG
MKNGFTLLESLVIIGILIILTGMAVPALRFFQKESDLNNSAEEIINTLRLAQNKTLASEGASQWGVYFSTSTTPHQFTLFKGTSFASRDPVFDEVHKLPELIKISEIDLAGSREIVFEQVTGITNQFGSVSLELESDPTKTKTIYIENFGQIGLTNSSVPSDANRIKDSRHLHFDYSRQIATSTEDLVLTFEGSFVETIIIADNIRNGQIFWEREVSVGGEIQKLKIHTHRLNDPLTGTQFCIHRDRRNNNKALTIDIDDTTDPDPGTLITYTAQGEAATGTSVYISGFELQ